MSLTKILRTRPEGPYSRPPTVRVAVLCVKEDVKVLEWEFPENGDIKPIRQRKNRVAIITDGEEITKITVFEGFCDNLAEGTFYLKNYTLWGEYPPYKINISKNTKFFQTAPMKLKDSLRARAELLLHPSSCLTPLASRELKGLLTVEGEVLQVSEIKKTPVGKAGQPVPMRTVRLQQDNTKVSLSLWRAAALLPITEGCQIRVSHVRGTILGYGYCLNSTDYTTVEVTTTALKIGVFGATPMAWGSDLLELLIEGDSTLEITEDMWLPLQEELMKLETPPLMANFTLIGNKVVTAEVAKIEAEAEAQVLQAEI